MSLRARRRLGLALTALMLLACVGTLSGGQGVAAQAQPGAVQVYVLQGGHQPSDDAAVAALRERGFAVQRGVDTAAFDGSQANLRAYDVVVILFTADWNLGVPQAGLDAIRAYVEGGGGLVTGEWFGWYGGLAEIMPTVNCTWNTAASTTYTRVAPNPVINAGLPDAFTFPLGDFAGSEACLDPRPEASVFYSSSNGGGRGPHVGLAAWNFGQGRVAGFSTLLGAAELQSAEYRTLFQNTVAWAASTRDATPPTVKQVDLAAAGGMVRSREVTLEVKASDSGGSGVGAVLVVEYIFSGDESEAWRLAATSGWRRYSPPGATLALTLSATPGVHYLHVYAADRAGNISREPVVVFVSYQPPGATPIGLDEAHIYRLALQSGAPVTARMRVAGGNPDLYVLGPGVQSAPVSDASVEEISFSPQVGAYDVGVIGYLAGSYSLEYGSNLAPAGAADGEVGIQRRGRGSVINLFPPEPEDDPSGLPPPPAPGLGLSLEPAVFLPAIQRP